MGFKEALNKQNEEIAGVRTADEERRAARQAKQNEDAGLFEALKQREVIDVLQAAKDHFAEHGYFAQLEPRITGITVMGAKSFSLELSLRRKGDPVPGTKGLPDRAFRLSVWFDPGATVLSYVVTQPKLQRRGQPYA